MPLLVHIDSIPVQGLKIADQVDALSLPLLKAVSDEAEIVFSQAVQVHLLALRSGETILIDGTVASQIRIPCRRCLDPFGFPLRSEFHVSAVPEEALDRHGPAANAVALTAEEMDVIVYTGSHIDLAAEVAQQVIMALPFSPLCRDTCKGLCTGCGINLNRAACACEPDEGTHPFAVLKTLSFKENNEA